jgi:hypothetical protein
MIQACVIKTILFSKTDYVFLKISSSLAGAERKFQVRILSIRKNLNTMFINPLTSNDL